MAITNLDGYISANKQQCEWTKTGTITTVAGGAFGIFGNGAYPFNSTLSAGNTSNGVVPIQGQDGYPYIKTFTGAKGYLSKLQGQCSLTGMIMFFDDLFKCGAYAFNTNTNLTAQPSFASRVPDADYRGLQLWFEAVTAFTGNPTVTVTYVNQNGVAGRTAVMTQTAPIINRMYRIALQQGDTGIQQITSIVGTVASAGTFNLHILRPLSQIAVRSASESYTKNLFETGMPEVFQNTAILGVIIASSTTSPTTYNTIEIADK